MGPEQSGYERTAESKATFVFGQMNEPPGARARVALSGLTIAEYYRDGDGKGQGRDILFFVDNIFRFTQAGSEVSALLGRMPSAVGYQPTLATEMGLMQERITSTKNGSITSVQAAVLQAAQGARRPDPRALGLGPPLLDGRRGQERPRPPAACPTPRRRSATSSRRVKQVQDFLERPLALENPSTLRRVRELDDARVGVSRARRRGGRLRAPPRREQHLRGSFNHGFDPRRLPRRRSRTSASSSSTSPATRTTGRTSSTRTSTT